MLIEGLQYELEYEGAKTRQLLQAIPNDLLTYKPNDFNWTLAELASHIAEIYFWWESTLLQDELKMEDYQYDKGDISDIKNIISKFEENLLFAKKALENYPEEKMYQEWKMTHNGKDLIPPSKRVGVVRGFLVSHMIHHRGEVIAFLRVNGRKVPGLYGPTYEEWNGK